MFISSAGSQKIEFVVPDDTQYIRHFSANWIFINGRIRFQRWTVKWCSTKQMNLFVIIQVVSDLEDLVAFWVKGFHFMNFNRSITDIRVLMSLEIFSKQLVDYSWATFDVFSIYIFLNFDLKNWLIFFITINHLWEKYSSWKLSLIVNIPGIECCHWNRHVLRAGSK